MRLLSKFSLSFSSPYNLQRYLLNMYLLRSWPRYNFNLKVNLYRLNIVLSGSCISLLPRAMTPLLHLYGGALVRILCHHGCPVSRITEYIIVSNNQRFCTISCNPYWQCANCAGNMPIVLAICQSCWLSANHVGFQPIPSSDAGCLWNKYLISSTFLLTERPSLWEGRGVEGG